MPLVKVEFVSVVLSMLKMFGPDGRSDREVILAWFVEFRKEGGLEGQRRLVARMSMLLSMDMSLYGCLFECRGIECVCHRDSNNDKRADQFF